MTETRCVVPVNDISPHDDFSESCPCRPRVEWVGFSKLIIHNSFDQRELWEKLEENKTKMVQ